VVVDATGAFLDPAAPPDTEGGSLRGHIHAGAQAVVVSSPFKSKHPNFSMPEDAITLLHGINHHLYDPRAHRLLSSASCTTTALAHMMRPLLDRNLTRSMITAGMSTVHAATNSQPVLDSVPKPGSKDLRKTRSALDNIIITSTNAAKTLEEVMPEIARIGFMADSVRVPTSTVSLIILNLTFQTDTRADGSPSIDRDSINAIYREAAEGEAHGLVKYTEEQNVSADIIGEDAAVVIEASETHTRTGFIDVRLPDRHNARGQTIQIPVTHVKVFGWYDNEMGSYTFRLGELTSHVARSI
jgi:glyceraldehyde 3-phosphate dehydrogenase